MTTVSFPSDAFPAFPAVTLTAVDGWQPLQAPQALLALGKVPTPEGEFQVNVALTNQRSVGTTLEHAAQATIDALSASPEWEEAGQEFRDGFGGRPSFRIEGAFSHPQAGTVYQAALITVVENGPFVDMVQLVGTCTASQAAECVPQIRQILQSAVLDAS